VTFPENDSITIEYYFDAYVDNPYNQGIYEIIMMWEHLVHGMDQ